MMQLRETLTLALLITAVVFGLGPGLFMLFCSLFSPAVRVARHASTRTKRYFHRENSVTATTQEK